jgi:hypothetical protein
VRRVCAPVAHGLGIPLSEVGCPIRKSADQSFFAAPRGLSQRSTSFIASQRQGIHRMPLRHLIALIINAHPLGSGPADRPFELAFGADSSTGWTLIRKTSLSSDRSDGVRSSSRHKTPPATLVLRPRLRTMLGDCVLRATSVLADVHHARLSERSYLFTMSDIAHPSSPFPQYGLGRMMDADCFSLRTNRTQLVEPDGIEPTTSCLQSRRSPN